jgi:clan AA aspartic protease
LSSFAGATPVLHLSLKNLFSGLTYPEKGSATGVMDTGYEGFLALPERAFKELELDRLATARTGMTADGRPIDMSSSVGSVKLEAVDGTYDGLVDTWPGIDEILVGTRLLQRLKVTLDYCSGFLRLEPCG